MKRIKKMIIIAVFVLIMIATFLKFQGISYSLKSGRVIDYLNFTADTDFIWISTEGSSVGSRPKELSNKEFEESYTAITSFEYYGIKMFKNVEIANNENVKYTIRISDGIKKHELLIVEKGIIIVDWFDEDGVVFTKLYIAEDKLKSLLKELSITNPL